MLTHSHRPCCNTTQHAALCLANNSLLQHMCTHPTNKQILPTYQTANQPTNQPASQVEQPTNQPTNNEPSNPKNHRQPANKPSPIAHRGGGGGGGGSITGRRGGGGTSTHSREGRSNTTCQCMSTAQPIFKCTLTRKPHLQKAKTYPSSP